jgi:hypothetical protein
VGAEGAITRASTSGEEDQMLPKPFRPDDLLRAIRRAFDG